MNLKDNKHLKEVESILDKWDIDKGYLTTNDLSGVDLISEISLKELKLEIEDEDEIAELLELHYDGSDYFFQRNKDDYYGFVLIASSCEEIFVTFEGYLCFPDSLESIKLSKENRELEIIAYSLEWMHNSGCFPSIFTLDYYSNSPTLYNFYETEEYKELGLSDKPEVQFKEVTSLVEILEFVKTLDENTMTLGELPNDFYEVLPNILKESDGELEVIEAEITNAHTMKIEFELDSDDDIIEYKALINEGILTKVISDKGGDNEYAFQIILSTLPNSIRFLKGLDGILGLTTQEIA